LDIDHQEDVLPGCRGCFNRLTQGAVQLAIKLGPFQEVAGCHTLLKSLAGEEMVFASILLSRPWGSRGTRHHLPHVGHLHHNALAEGRFASA
jgi:hypothetical protein